MPLSTNNNYAAKLYDAALTQYVGWYDDNTMDGLTGTLNQMVKEDPTFGKLLSFNSPCSNFLFAVSGRALNIGLQLLGKKYSIRNNSKFASDLEDLQTLVAQNENLPYREKKHTEAVVRWAEGDLYGAAMTWEDILVEHPTDIHALKMAHDTYFTLGKMLELRDSLARVMPIWTSKTIPLEGYLHGMYAFGLEETRLYSKAEVEVKKALDMNRHDAFAVHALAHCREMETRTREGIEWMTKTERD